MNVHAGPIPPDLGNLTVVTDLWLHNNKLSGESSMQQSLKLMCAVKTILRVFDSHTVLWYGPTESLPGPVAYGRPPCAGDVEEGGPCRRWKGTKPCQ